MSRYDNRHLPADPFTITWREPEPSFWMLYHVRGGVLVPARIWWCDHEPGRPDNKLDRWPIPFLAAEIAGRWCEVYDVWWRVCLRDSRPGHWKCAHPMAPKDGLTEEEEYAYQMALLATAGTVSRRPADLRSIPLPF